MSVNIRYVSGCSIVFYLVSSAFFIVLVSSMEYESTQNRVLLPGSEFLISCDKYSATLYSSLIFKSVTRKRVEVTIDGETTTIHGSRLDKGYLLRANVSYNSRLLVSIFSVQSQDAGRYICEDPLTGAHTSSLQLIVIESQPRCYPSLQVGDNSNTANISCSINYTGFWEPQLQWKYMDHSNITSVQRNETVARNISTLTYIATVDRRNISVDYEKYYCVLLFSLDNKPSGTHANNLPQYNRTCGAEIRWPMVTADPRNYITDPPTSSISILDSVSSARKSLSVNVTSSLIITNDLASTTTTTSPTVISVYWSIMGAVIGVLTLLVSIAFGATVIFFIIQQRRKPDLSSHVCTRTAEKSTSLSRSTDMSIFRNRRQRVSSFLSQFTRSSTNYDESEYAEIVSRHTSDVMKSNTTMSPNKAVYAQVNKNKDRNLNQKSDIPNIMNTPDVICSPALHNSSQMSDLDEVMYALKPSKEIYDTCPLDNPQRYDMTEVDGYSSTTDL